MTHYELRKAISEIVKGNKELRSMLRNLFGNYTHLKIDKLKQAYAVLTREKAILDEQEQIEMEKRRKMVTAVSVPLKDIQPKTEPKLSFNYVHTNSDFKLGFQTFIDGLVKMYNAIDDEDIKKKSLK